MFQVKPIGFVENKREDLSHDFLGEEISTITLADHMKDSSLDGIDEYSHIEIIFYFDQVRDEEIEYGSKIPRNNPNYPKVGILAQRSKYRPNKLGLTTVKLLKRENRVLYVQGLDAVKGTPILDIKPVLKEYLPREEVRQPQWFSDLMKNYWL